MALLEPLHILRPLGVVVAALRGRGGRGGGWRGGGGGKEREREREREKGREGGRPRYEIRCSYKHMYTSA
jgi:hypothetical protein